MKFAVVHEWLDTLAGSERVIEQFLKTFPGSDLFSLVDFLEDKDRDALQGVTPKTSFVQNLPFAKKHFRNYLPLMPSAVEQFDMSDYDVILSSNHAFAKGVITRPDQMHVSYVHTPIRYAWELQHEYLRASNLMSGLKATFVRGALHYLRVWDRLAADRVDVFLANSKYIAKRIEKTYRRRAHVVYPPVNVQDFAFNPNKDDFYLAASRMVPYKRIDLVVDAFVRMPDKQLIVIGDGSEYDKIAAKATPNVTLMGYQKFDVLRDHMQRAKGFVFAAEEDFGIMPVEAQACGTPVIAFGQGGARETVVGEKTGIFFDKQTPESLVSAIESFEGINHTIDPHVVRAHAEKFSRERFRREMSELVDRCWDQFCDQNRADYDRYVSADRLDNTAPIKVPSLAGLQGIAGLPVAGFANG